MKRSPREPKWQHRVTRHSGVAVSTGASLTDPSRDARDARHAASSHGESRRLERQTTAHPGRHDGGKCRLLCGDLQNSVAELFMGLTSRVGLHFNPAHEN